MTDALRTPFEQGRAAEAARVQAVTEFGFTERQARFLVLVTRHSGICVPRQYATFAGIANGGRRCNAFFDKLTRRGYAHEIQCLHNRARVFHVHHKPLYFLIGESTSRNRRPVPPRLALERLMLLDAVLMMPDVEWLTTTEEKTRYRARREVSGEAIAAAAPVSEASATPPRLTSAFPVGLSSEGRTVLLYLATDPSTEPFRSFLQTHASLLRVAPSWTLRLVFPRPLSRASDAYQAVVHEELSNVRAYRHVCGRDPRAGLGMKTGAHYAVRSPMFEVSQFGTRVRVELTPTPTLRSSDCAGAMARVKATLAAARRVAALTRATRSRG